MSAIERRVVFNVWEVLSFGAQDTKYGVSPCMCVLYVRFFPPVYVFGICFAVILEEIGDTKCNGMWGAHA